MRRRNIRPDYIRGKHKDGRQVLIPYKAWYQWSVENNVANALESMTQSERRKGWRFTKVYEDEKLERLSQEAEKFYLTIDDILDMYGYLPEPLEEEPYLVPKSFHEKTSGTSQYKYVYYCRYSKRWGAKISNDRRLGMHKTESAAHQAVQEFFAAKQTNTE